MSEQMLSPNGELVDFDFAISEWKRLGSILQERLNCTVYAYSPGFCVQRQGEIKTLTAEIPTWLALEIAAWPNPRFVAEGYMAIVNGKKTYFDAYAEANSRCDKGHKPTILYDILQKPTQTG